MKNMSLRQKRKVALYVMLLPSILGFGVFYLLPYVLSLGISLFATPAFTQYVGLDNYVALFRNEAFRLTMYNTVRFILTAVPLNVGIALLLALWLHASRKISSVLKGSAILPIAIPAVSVAAVLNDWLQMGGVFNRILAANTDYLASEHSFFIAIGIFLWKNTGMMLMLIMIGLESVPEEYYQWIALDTKSKWQIFCHVTAVYLRPTFFLVVIFSIINVFKVFKDIHLLFGKYPDKSIYMLQHFMNNNFYSLNYSKLCTAAFAVSAVIYILVHLLYYDERRKNHAVY